MTKNITIFSLVLTGVASLTIAIGIGRFSYTPILPFMITEIGLTTTQGGLIASANFFGYLIGSLIPILPFFPKKIRNVFFLSIFICILTVFLMGFVQDLNFFIFIRFVHGVFSAFVLILGTSIILPHIQELGKIHLSTAHFSGVGLGMVFSSIVVSLFGYYGYQWNDLWIAIGILSVLLSLQIIFYTPHEIELSNKNPINQQPSRFGFTLISISYCLYGFGYVAFGTFISTMARTTIGIEVTEPYVWLIVGLSGIPSVFFWNWFSQKIGNDISLFLACSILGSGVLVSVLFNNPFGILFSSFLFGLTFIPITAMCLLEGQKRFPGSFIVSTAILTSSFSIGQMIGPYLAGFITDLTGSFYISMYFSGLTLIFGSFLMINPRRFIKN
tara:strand:- start:1625 stop:2782 length:1158 start_codon:yes stop_codon:yes gene_type:complete